MTIIQQTSIDQTGLAIFKTKYGKEKYVPLFSLTPFEESKEIASYMGQDEPKHVFITNNLCDYKIEDEIKNYQKEHNGTVSEELMDQLASGFPFIEGKSSEIFLSCYS